MKIDFFNISFNISCTDFTNDFSLKIIRLDKIKKLHSLHKTHVYCVKIQI